MSMANVTKTTRIQAIAELQKRKTEIQNRLQNGQSQDSTTIGGNSFTEDEWKKIIQKMDEYLTEVKQEQKERFEKRDKEKEIQQFYEKMKMAEQYKKPQAEKLTIQKHLDGEDIAPYSYLAEDGVITYNGVSFFCDYENNAITLGDMSDEKNVREWRLPESEQGQYRRSVKSDCNVFTGGYTENLSCIAAGRKSPPDAAGDRAGQDQAASGGTLSLFVI